MFELPSNVLFVLLHQKLLKINTILTLHYVLCSSQLSDVTSQSCFSIRLPRLKTRLQSGHNSSQLTIIFNKPVIFLLPNVLDAKLSNTIPAFVYLFHTLTSAMTIKLIIPKTNEKILMYQNVLNQEVVISETKLNERSLRRKSTIFSSTCLRGQISPILFFWPFFHHFLVQI